MVTLGVHQSPVDASPVGDDGIYEVLVSRYDGTAFSGDWRWSAECPAVGCASDGRTREESLAMVKDAILGMLSDYPPGQYPLRSDDAIAQVRAEYDAAGWRYTSETVIVSGLNPYR